MRSAIVRPISVAPRAILSMSGDGAQATLPGGLPTSAVIAVMIAVLLTRSDGLIPAVKVDCS